MVFNILYPFFIPPPPTVQMLRISFFHRALIYEMTQFSTTCQH